MPANSFKSESDNLKKVKDIVLMPPKVRNLPEHVEIDRKCIHIKSVKVGQKFLMTPGMTVDFNYSHIVTTTVTLKDDMTKTNWEVNYNETFLVVEKTQQRMTLKFKCRFKNPDTGIYKYAETEAYLFFRRNLELYVDTVFQNFKKKRESSNPFKENEQALNELRNRSENDREIQKEFRRNSRM